ncbi:MAG TPA: class I SAM-dependent methyltransferase, partial [Steroidobacteraceae bacterium]|nr:class I SAM-dependent methyltransferase [Steroidobacteraceae bacterium]
GADISVASLRLAARKGIYRSLVHADLLRPLPFSADTFDAAICVGVLSYISGEEFFRELCRVTRAGGALVLSHRTDLIASRSFEDLLRSFEERGLWSPVSESASLPYLPKHPDFADRIQVRYFALRVR